MRHSAYTFAIAAGLVLMVLEQYVSDTWMVILIAAAVIAHVWLTRTAVQTTVEQDRHKTIDATLSALHLLDRVKRQQSE